MSANINNRNDSYSLQENHNVFEAAFIVLREAAELLLLGEATLLGLGQAGHPELRRRYHVGTVVGIACGLALGGWAGPQLPNNALAGAVGLAFMVSVLALACTLLSSAMKIRERAFDRVEVWVNRPWGRSAVWIVALIIGLRETLEAVVMLVALDQRQPSRMVGAGMIVGLLGVALMVFAYKTLKERVKLLALFRFSAVLVSLIAVQLLLAHAGGMLVQRLGDENGRIWVEVANAVLPGGAWHVWICAALMAAPLWILARSWWSEAAER